MEDSESKLYERQGVQTMAEIIDLRFSRRTALKALFTTIHGASPIRWMLRIHAPTMLTATFSS